MKTTFKPGDACKVPKKGGGFYEAYVSNDDEGKAYSRYPGTIVVGMNWDGDLVFVDQRPKDLVPIPIEELSTSMRRDAMKLRQTHYLLPPSEPGAS